MHGKSLVKHIWSCGLVYIQMLQLRLYFLTAKVKSIKDITFIFAELWDIIQLFSGEHRAKVIVHNVGHVINGAYIQIFRHCSTCKHGFA